MTATTTEKKRRTHILRNTKLAGTEKEVAAVFGAFFTQRVSGPKLLTLLDDFIDAADRQVFRDEMIFTLLDAGYDYDVEEGRQRIIERLAALASYRKMKGSDNNN